MILRRSWLLSLLMPAIAIAALMGAVLSLVTRAPSHRPLTSANAPTQTNAVAASTSTVPASIAPASTAAQSALAAPAAPAPATMLPAGPLIEATGTVEPAGGVTDLSAQAEGVVATIAVQAGDDVRAGDIILQLDNRAARATVAMEQAAVGLAQAQLVEAGSNLADQQDQFDRVERMFKTMPRLASSPDQLARRSYAVATARAQVAKAQAVVDRSNAALAAAQVALDLLTVHAPGNATVLRINTHVGAYAARDNATPLVTLGQLHPLYVRVPIEAADISRFDPRQVAYAFPAGSRSSQQKLRARLTLVHVDPTLVPRNALTGQGAATGGDRVLGVVYALDTETFRAYPGQTIEVSIAPQVSSSAAQ